MTLLHHFSDIIHKFEKTRLLCLGDVMMDCFIYGNVQRISPEAPVPVFSVARKTYVLGGAGNVVRNLAMLGVNVSFSALVGNDYAGEQVASLLQELGKVKAELYKDQNRPTTLKTRYIAGGQQLMRADQETTITLSSQHQQEIKDYFKKSMDDVDGVILSDYHKGFLAPDLLRELIKIAKEKGKTIIVDPKGHDYSIYKGVTILTPNVKELAQATRMPVSTPEEVVEAARYLMSQFNFENVLVTRGAQGMALVTKTDEPYFIEAHALEVYDVSGAGDTVIAVLSASLAAGADIKEAVRLANIAAGIVVAKVGTATVTRNELTSQLEQEEGGLPQEKVLSWQELADRMIDWHRRGLKVGFTNGCYDLIHSGHLSLLGQAKTRCDRLVVGLNTDASVSRLKGPTRPVNKEQDRAFVLASLTNVDAVVLFDQDTPLDLIKHMRPDLLVKGEDYTLDKVVGAQEVMSWGGTVFLAELKDGYSTTNTIKKLSA
ncbi:D-glycero-beta-D-manno-heptose-7-phosphate kinase [Candidatus Nucleicultrix amoebiphila]|jgi:D-beta-D-heptose 7-phosphate kinase/D-beta-D-heptose 1-phosphate adenosyltransferase|uniref:Bifunctional protein HldE n=1 Tax=Candidatus Nucleicultrix amoebiphila FS5 TaxID=1414854 RepID=A0A1W6N4W1_9PROT|nr:D-glycero-beta-D-manno-heptose-7-phosphate kinase [Candidatus Nucleicultrix amoebiphila]ARN84910.1 D-beta-D-heptose 1-phosphate adenosyltransferase [Candidatus Nucleicultrix amoebiphila FS5]